MGEQGAGVRLLDDGASVRELARLVAGAERVALDTEADSLHSYPERLCLLQVGLPGRDELVDPLSPADLAPLLDALAVRPLVLHGADYDLRLLHRAAGFRPVRVFDTMIAARLLGAVRFGLGDLVAEHLGVELAKGMQKADWGRRPLTPAMAEYARLDIRHLLALAELLGERLVAAGRLSWHDELCGRLVEDCVRALVADPDAAFRLKGSETLGPRGLAVLRELWRTREQEAVAASRPPFFVVAHGDLVRLAAEAERGGGREAPRLPARLPGRRRRLLANAVRRGLELPEDALPEPRARRSDRPRPEVVARVGRLREARDRVADRLGIDPTLIASRATLLALARDPEPDLEAVRLLPWQRDLLLG